VWLCGQVKTDEDWLFPHARNIGVLCRTFDGDKAGAKWFWLWSTWGSLSPFTSLLRDVPTFLVLGMEWSRSDYGIAPPIIYPQSNSSVSL
jgi:hypothetical protein